MHHFFVTPEAVLENEITVTGSDVNHIKNVLRMKKGEQLLISNGEGKDYLCSVSELKEDEITCEIVDGSYEGTELPSKIYLFQGLPKLDKLETVIQKAVELGAYEIIPVKTKRSIAKIEDKKIKSKTERFNAISESAAKQSRRGIIPRVLEPMSFKEALSYAENMDVKLIPYENYKDMEATRKALTEIGPGKSIAVFIGPEGGFDESEIALSEEKGFNKICLGKRILRTETAPLAILSIIMFGLES